MYEVDDVIAIADAEWRSMGVVPRDRDALATDLRLELTAAAEDGVTPQELLGDNIRGFARSLAEEAGARRVPYETKRLLLTALTGAVPGIVVGWVYLWRLPYLPPDNLASLLLAYVLLSLLVLVGALVAVRVQMGDTPAIGRTVWAMALLVPIAGGLITPVTMGFAWLTGYKHVDVGGPCRGRHRRGRTERRRRAGPVLGAGTRAPPAQPAQRRLSTRRSGPPKHDG